MIFDKSKAVLKAKKEHGFKYLYYFNQCDKNTFHVKCPYHGRFTVPTFPHLFKGVGCPKCREGDVVPFEFFKEKFDALGLKHIRVIKPLRWSPFGSINIKCKHHGTVSVRPFNLLNGKDCPDCGRGIRGKAQFIKEANKVHKKKFDYSTIPEGNVHGDIVIVCPVHGSIRMNSLAHLGGTGCRSCVYNNDKYFYIYMFLVSNGRKGFYKLGLAKDVGKREVQLRRGLKKGWSIKLLKAVKYRSDFGSFKAEYFFLSSFPGEKIKDKSIMKDGMHETKVNGLSVNKAMSYFSALDRRYRRIWKEYIPKRQLYNAEQRMSKRNKRKSRKRFKFKT